MRRAILTSVAAIVLAAAIAVPALAGTSGVKIGDNWFVAKSGSHTVSVKAGTTVRWTWTGKAPHDVVVTSGPQKFSSGNAKTKGTYSKKVTKKGTYKIICQIHPGMAMTLKVS